MIKFANYSAFILNLRSIYVLLVLFTAKYPHPLSPDIPFRIGCCGQDKAGGGPIGCASLFVCRTEKSSKK